MSELKLFCPPAYLTSTHELDLFKSGEDALDNWLQDRAIDNMKTGATRTYKKWQGKGLGKALLLDAVQRSIRASREVSARLLIVHSISAEAEDFYLHHGFIRLPVETTTFAIDLIKFADLN